MATGPPSSGAQLRGPKPCQAVGDQPYWGMSGAGRAVMGARPWAGTARAGGAPEALAARKKGSTPALLGQPGRGSQAQQGGKGYEILPSTQLTMALGLTRVGTQLHL